MYKLSRTLLIMLICTLPGMGSAADSLLASDHPTRYTVVKGDTLWDIAGRFLRNPWDWPQLWHVNPQIQNPHLIFPGDTLELVYDADGKPQLQMQDGPRVVKLSPQIRSTPWDGSIPTIPYDAVAPFLNRSLVLDSDYLDHAPYIVEFADEHVVGGPGNRAYVRGLDAGPARRHIVRAGKPYKDADSGEILGYAAEYIAQAQLQREGDPATVTIDDNAKEVVVGDRLITVDDKHFAYNFLPHAPDRQVRGNIIAMFDGVGQIGQYDVVVLDRGHSDGLRPGSVLRIDQRGREVRDLVTADLRDTVVLPDEQAGLLLVFRAFDRVSLALIMTALRPIHLQDTVRNP